MKGALRFENVTKQFSLRGRVVPVLQDVTFEFREGEFACLVGASGSGKSTLLLMLGGMLSPSKGQVFLGEKPLYQLSARERARARRANIGFVFQSFNLVPYLTAMENVQTPMYLAGVDEASQKQRAAKILERLGLGDKLDHKPSELSVGQQQRVAIARALANDPPTIMADEPTGSLDPENGRATLALLEELHQEGRTVIMVTHDLTLAAKAGRILRLINGGIKPEAA